MNDLSQKCFSELESVEFINKIEEKFPVDEWKIDDVEIWPIIRKDIAVYLQREKTIFTKKNTFLPQKYINILKIIFIFFKSYLLDKKHNTKKRVYYDVLISSNNSSRTVKCLNGEMYDVNCDPFFDLLQEKYQILIYEQLYTDNQNLPRYSDSSFVNIKFVKSLIYSRLFCKSKNSYKLDGYDEFVNFISQNDIPQTLVNIKRLTKEVNFLSYLSNIFFKELVNKKIKFVLFEEYYSRINMALSLACNKMYIPCMDIQHGCAGESYHVMYYSWKNIPNKGYKLLPTVFWCWSDSDAEAIKNWKFKEKKVKTINGGRLIRRQWFKKSSDIYKHYYSKLNKKILGKHKIILITLQPGAKYPDWFMNFVNNDKKYFWIVRTHPCNYDDLQRNFKLLLQNKVNILFTESSDYPLEFLLSVIDLHVTFSSSTIIDSAYFGKPSIMLDNYNMERYERYHSLGYLEYANSIDEFILKSEKLIKNLKVYKVFGANDYDKAINELISLINNSCSGEKIYENINN